MWATNSRPQVANQVALFFIQVEAIILNNNTKTMSTNDVFLQKDLN